MLSKQDIAVLRSYLEEMIEATEAQDHERRTQAQWRFDEYKAFCAEVQSKSCGQLSTEVH